MTAKEVQKQIRELRREMKARGIRVTSCFNGGHTQESLSFNQALFALKVKLEKADKP